MINEDKLANFLLYLENQSEKDFSKWLTGVNIFEILGIESAEIRHSRVLAWLLDPRENHYLKDKFLKKFLLKVIQNNLVVPEIETTEVLLKDFSKGEVFRESKNNIDILFSNSEYKFNLIIENKIFTSDHDNQLTKYRTFVENSYVGYRNIYIYLTPNGASPVDASIEERNYWKLLSYKEVSDILEELFHDDSTDDKVAYIIKEYNDNIRRNILNDLELKELSAEIYFKYKEILDLIIDNRPTTSVFREKLIEILNSLSEQNRLIFNEKYCSKTFLRFRTKQLDDFLENVINDNNREWLTGSSYFYEITYDNFQAAVYLSISLKNQTEVQSKKLATVTHSSYSKYGFNTSNRFLSFDASEENLLLTETFNSLIKFLHENLQQIDEFEKDLILKWTEYQKEGLE